MRRLLLVVAAVLLLANVASAIDLGVYEKPARESWYYAVPTITAGDSLVVPMNSKLASGRIDVFTYYCKSGSCSLRIYSGSASSGLYVGHYQFSAGQSYDFPVNADSIEIYAVTNCDSEVFPWRF